MVEVYCQMRKCDWRNDDGKCEKGSIEIIETYNERGELEPICDSFEEK